MSSSNFRCFLVISLAWIGLGAVGCARTVSTPSPSPSSSPPGLPEIVIIPSPPLPPPPSSPPPEAEKPLAPEERGEAEELPGPRAVASLQMTEQGRALLEQKKIDDAIGVLERAVNLNPTNGQNYYYLAEAWLLKRNPKQAEEFNYMAGIYLAGDQKWMFKVEEQERRIKLQTF